ncbi:hypothetical protein FJ208_00945, partial [Candidatus Gribaldobacteria bacterium]|nr:hypothetical protein [Candidatus Gribaldobacteria bacterium]
MQNVEKQFENNIGENKAETKEQLPVDEHEHIVDIESPEIKQEIEKAKETFEKFFEKYRDDFDLSDEEKIEKLIETAEKEKVLEKAQAIRELIYGKNISLYGVSYLSNKCDQCCSYCPMGQAALAERWQKEILDIAFQKERKDLASSWVKIKKAFERGELSLDELALVKSYIIKTSEITKRGRDISYKSF